MKLPKNYFESLSPSKYRAYLKLLPNMQKENTRAVTMLIFTFVALGFLSLFAINPTLSTIIDLHKQLEDSEFVHQQLTTKMNNLSTLQRSYINLSEDLTFLYDAIPETAKAPTLVGQIESLAEQTQVTITDITISPLIISDPNQPEGVKSHSSFSFTLQAEGEYQNMLAFARALTNFDRIVTIESASFIKDEQNNKLLLGIKGREYFKNKL